MWNDISHAPSHSGLEMHTIKRYTIYFNEENEEITKTNKKKQQQLAEGQRH